MTDSLTRLLGRPPLLGREGEWSCFWRATLIDCGGALGGNVTEPCTEFGCSVVSTHNAIFNRPPSTPAVQLTDLKRYGLPGYGYDTVIFEGVASTETTEIHGHWQVRRHPRSGTFA